MALRVQVTGADDLRKASRKIREAANPREVRKELTQALKQSTAPAVADAKVAALAIPAKGRASTGLRRRMARGVTAQVKTGGRTPGVKVRISRRVMGKQAPVPMLMNEGQWRHPVFGEDTWVEQRGDKNWFDNVIDRHKRGVRAGIKRAIDELERKLKT